MTRTAVEAKQIITGILTLLGLDEKRFAVAVRRNGAVNAVAVAGEADQVLITNEHEIWEASAKAGSPFILKFVKGYPVLTNEAG